MNYWYQTAQKKKFASLTDSFEFWGGKFFHLEAYEDGILIISYIGNDIYTELVDWGYLFSFESWRFAYKWIQYISEKITEQETK